MKKIKNLFTINLFLISSLIAQSNYSLSFDGSDDYVIMGDVLDQEGDFSFSVWVYLEQQTYTAIASKRVLSGEYSGWDLVVDYDQSGSGDDGVIFSIYNNGV